MSMIDYGAVVIKNGKVVNHSMFEEMNEAVGWNDEGRPYINPTTKEEYKYSYLNGNYYAYVGDKGFTLAFYKSCCRISWQDNNTYFYSNLEFDGLKSHNFTVNEITYNIKEICSRVYLCTLDYKGDHYKVIFGYGIDPNMDVWNKVKVIYLGKKNANKVDNIYKRWIREQ